MIAKSRNGLKLDVSPRRWWNILDWITVIEQVNIVKNQDIYMKTEDWKFVRCTVSDK